ncbi:MAG: outer membrane protein assembly factor BamB family protein [Treponema sp.]
MNKVFSALRAALKTGAIAFILSTGNAAFGSEDALSLSFDNADWTSVLSGKAVCQPEAASYGFAALTDGRMISACTHAGKKLWERGVKGKPEPYLTVFAEDFLLVASGKSTFSLVNPSGLTLWSKDAGFAITEKPQAGHDGRIFVRGKRNAACYGINGVQKWTLDLPEQGAIPLTVLNDGSLLAFLEDLSEDGRTQAVRISPYGETLAALTFSSAVAAVKSVRVGAVLVFSGGGLALCAAENGHSVIKWSIPSGKECFSGADAGKGAHLLALADGKAAVFLAAGGGSRVVVFDAETGAVLSAFDTDIAASSLTCAAAADGSSAIFAADAKIACLFDWEGTTIWRASLPPQTQGAGWEFSAYDGGGYFVLCRNSWTLNGYKTVQDSRYASPQKRSGRARFNISDVYAAGEEAFALFDLMDSLGEEYTGRKRRARLLEGGYGKEEALVERALFGASAAYLRNAAVSSRAQSRTVFEKDAAGFDAVIAQLPLMGTSAFPPLIAELLKRDTANVHVNSLLRAAAECAYDPDGALLSAVEEKIKNPSALSKRSLCAACDCIYEICRFMGRSALWGRGLVMLQTMMTPPYDASVRAYARKTAAKLSELKM